MTFREKLQSNLAGKGWGKHREPSFESAAPAKDAWTSVGSAFLYSCMASAIGLGSLQAVPLYRRPERRRVPSSSCFLVFIVVLCVPLMMAEMLIGKRGGGSALLSISNMIRGERAWGRVEGDRLAVDPDPVPGAQLLQRASPAGACSSIGVAAAHGFDAVTPRRRARSSTP